MKKITISINKQTKKWDSKIVRQLTKDVFTALSSEDTLLKRMKKISLNILLADDKELQKLKKEFFGKDQPTNVLSFPAYEEVSEFISDPDGYIGDIAISYTTVYNEADEQKKNFNFHLTHLILHSILHLIGFDHENEPDADKMEALEVQVLAKMGISNPYVLTTT
jgi:probable rRNA maturation factor